MDDRVNAQINVAMQKVFQILVGKMDALIQERVRALRDELNKDVDHKLEGFKLGLGGGQSRNEGTPT